MDGFLRPGGSYKTLVDYLFARYAESYELGNDFEKVLTRDWKTKLAANLVPRNLENDTVFMEAVIAQLNMVVRAKYEQEVCRFLGRQGLEPVEEEAIAVSLANMLRAVGLTASPPATPPSLSAQTSEANDVIGYVISGVLLGLKQIFDHALLLRLENQRISSELSNQPLAVDTFIEDFAVEAQNFATSLTQVTIETRFVGDLRQSRRLNHSFHHSASRVWHSRLVLLRSVSCRRRLLGLYLTFLAFFRSRPRLERWRTRRGIATVMRRLALIFLILSSSKSRKAFSRS